MFSIKFDKKSKKYVQIAEYFRESIIKESLMVNSKLPSTRELSESLGVGRSTVLRAYERLEMQGYVYTIEGKGTYVSGGKKKETERSESEHINAIFNWEDNINSFGKKAVELDIMKWDSQFKKGMISFKSIAPSSKTFDLEGFKRAFYNRISLEESNILSYGYARGYQPLCKWLLQYMEDKGIDTRNKDILITNGFTEGFNLVISALMEEGDKILCENPTHNTAIKIMKLKNLNLVGLSIKDQHGIDLEELKSVLEKEKIKAAFLIPSYHNPTGIVMDVNKRRQIYKILTEYKVMIIEDWFAEELRHSGDHIKSISALSRGNNNVINIGSFSKILFPGLRIGWVFGDKKLIDYLESVKRSLNIHTSFLDQGILYEYLKGEDVHKFIKRIKRSYNEKFEFTKRMVEKYIPCKRVLGEGGLYVYVVLEEEINARRLLEKCIDRDVIFTCGDIFRVDNGEVPNNIINGMRLGFSRLTKEDIQKGTKIIGEEVRKLKAKKS